MAKSCRSYEERAVGKRGSQSRTEIAVVESEILGQIVIKRYLVLVIEIHGLVFGPALDSMVKLLGRVILANKTIVQAFVQSVVGKLEVGFLV